MRGALATVVIVMAASIALTAWATPPLDGALRYVVHRNGTQLGTHVIRFRNHGTELDVVHTVRVLVRVLFVTAYRYDSDRTETWRDDQLVGLRARTNDNGDRVDVSVRRVGAGLLVRKGRSSTTAPADAVVAGPAWNVLARRPNRMIDDAEGRVLRVSVSAPAAITLRLGSRRRIPCERYRISGDLDATYWYRVADGVLVQERLRAPDDSEVWTRLL